MVWELRPELYRCRHFSKAYSDQFDKNYKGTVGENFLYDALKALANEERISPPELLGEPTPVYDPEIIARTNDYPDCYLKIDDKEFLFECKNLFYYPIDHPREPPNPFFVQQENWVRELATWGKRWFEPEYPIRGTSRKIRKGDHTEWVYERRVRICSHEPIHSTIRITSIRNGTCPCPDIQSVGRVYVATVPTYNGWARSELEGFFGENLVFTQHAMLSPEMEETPEDHECRLTTFAYLKDELRFLMERNLPGKA